MAEKWLEDAKKLAEAGLGSNYRKLRKSWVNTIAQDIIDDKFMYNGDSVKLGVQIPLNGELLRVIHDASHRLSAVVMAGKPMRLIFFEKRSYSPIGAA